MNIFFKWIRYYVVTKKEVQELILGIYVAIVD